MNRFDFYNPVKIYFGEGSICNLKKELESRGRNILLTYGMGSIKKNGIYDEVIKILNETGKNVYELGSITPNPRADKVYEGIRICKDYNIDFMLAVGGGSVIDCTKAISAGSKTDKDFWEEYFVNYRPLTDATPFGTVLTIAATGSEMDRSTVISKPEEKIKTSYSSELLYPAFSILDPVYTYSLPVEQMVYGAVDTLSHIFESYFSKPDESNVSDDLSEALIKNIIKNLDAALNNTKDYVARSNLMWASTVALNGFVSAGKEEDWLSHQIEHTLSAFYDIPHGAGLSIIHPNYLKYIYKNSPARFARYAVNVWGVDPIGKTDKETALLGIEKTQEYFKNIGAPVTLTEVGIPPEALDDLVEKTELFKTSYSDLTSEDLKNILELSL